VVGVEENFFQDVAASSGDFSGLFLPGLFKRAPSEYASRLHDQVKGMV
jgi:hypothetical protein